MAAREGVYETRAGSTKVVHRDCQGPVFGSAPRPRGRTYVEPVAVSFHGRVGAALRSHRRASVGALLGLLALGTLTLLVGAASGDDEDPGDSFAIVEWTAPTTTSTTTTTTSTTTTLAPTTTPAPPPVQVAAVVETRPPRTTAAPAPVETVPPLPPPTEAPVETTTVAPETTTTAAPQTTTTTTTTTAAPEDREGRRRCDDDDRRPRCRDRADDRRGRDDD